MIAIEREVKKRPSILRQRAARYKIGKMRTSVSRNRLPIRSVIEKTGNMPVLLLDRMRTQPEGCEESTSTMMKLPGPTPHSLLSDLLPKARPLPVQIWGQRRASRGCWWNSAVWPRPGQGRLPGISAPVPV